MKITLSNNKKFECNSNQTIFEAAKKSGVFLEHSCLSGRCRSCIVKVISGTTENSKEEIILTDKDKNENFVLSCIATPKSDIELDIEDLGSILIYKKSIIPAKVYDLEKLNENILKVTLRLPPKTNFKFISGQYVNIIKGNLSRSYSIANSPDHSNYLEFFIKKYSNGQMSKFLFDEAKINDLLRIEGPLGTFFLRESKLRNIIFLATGTGIAPIKAILENLEKSPKTHQNKTIWVFVGARFKSDFFWKPYSKKLNINYVPVLSRPDESWNGEKGYVQEVLLKKQINLTTAQVYACGSNNMINSARELTLKNNLKANNFFSDAFVQSN